ISRSTSGSRMTESPSPQLFVITASDPSAREHVEKSIAHPIDPNLCAAHFSEQLLNQVKAQSGDGQLYAWGAIPGRSNTRNWALLRPGDFMILYQTGFYTFVARVITKQKNKAFAKALWKTRADGETWELMYFLTHPSPTRVPIQELFNPLP